ncbi:MAG: MBL fold metallo-hydrolase [Gammaproteobacteria bacterium]|nr:MBL fold metallo-hydrolase [Gammaproteobacteria bacterium]
MNILTKPEVTGFFDKDTNTVSYVVRDPTSQSCAVIDSVTDLDYAAGRIHYQSANQIIEHISQNDLILEWIIETHAHADHLSAAPYIQEKLGGKIGIGQKITMVQKAFGQVFGNSEQFRTDGSQFDRLFSNNDSYEIGNMKAVAISTPGHTPACMSHVIGDAIFVGDTIFMPDGGTARVDFPGGDARQLFQSIQRILSYPEETRLFVCHDYGPNGRDFRWQTSVREQRENSIHVRDNMTEEEFITIRTERDKQLGMPKLIIPSIQVNIRAGHLPEKDPGGTRFIKVPLNVL